MAQTIETLLRATKEQAAELEPQIAGAESRVRQQQDQLAIAVQRLQLVEVKFAEARAAHDSANIAVGVTTRPTAAPSSPRA